MNPNPLYPASNTNPSSLAGINGLKNTADRDPRDAEDARATAQTSTVNPADREHPLLGSRVAGPRSLTVIYPPSFAPGTIVTGIRNLICYRDLLYTLTVFRLAVRYKQSILGWIWAALQPLGMMIVYTFVFSSLARVRSEGMPYPLFVFSGLLPWIFFSGSVSNAINGMVSHSTLITKLYFPREIIPLSYVFAALVDFGVSCAILFGLMLYYGATLSWKILFILPVVAILIAFTSAVALFLSSIQVRFRDTAAALPVLLQIGVFATPVAYSVESIPTRLQRLYLLNPVASLIEDFRRVILRGSAPDLSLLLTSGVVTFFCLAFAYAYFKATESTMSDVI
ncbi:MAG: ABC transporter permease [Acidobacteriaceae bacterium]